MKRILVAPLNWGLGHATRCFPIIRALKAHNFEPVIASDGAALNLLKLEFPDLEHVELPSYNITYPINGKRFKSKLISETPMILNTIRKEKSTTASLVKKKGINGIISDNRFGVRHRDVTSVFITHQLQVLSGRTTKVSTFLHQQIIRKFDRCWIPDFEHEPSLSGKLGHSDRLHIPKDYLGPLSRMTHQEASANYKLLVLLSGPEPQRSLLEAKLLDLLDTYEDPVLFVKGLIEKPQSKYTLGPLEVWNYMTAQQLSLALNSSEMVLCRSGYSSIMDLAKLGKKVFFIPTPGQFEQEYLAEKFQDEKIAPYRRQEDFELSDLESIEQYSGFKPSASQIDYEALFRFF